MFHNGTAAAKPFSGIVMHTRGITLGGLALAVTFAPLAAQQVADLTFQPAIEIPAYPPGAGPVVLIDEAHKNFHTAGGRYQPFAELLRRDGYVVTASAEPLTTPVLRAGRVLVIANAVVVLTEAEKTAVGAWVADGGSLWLIADHPPYDGAAKELGTIFGIQFSGRVGTGGQFVFRRSDRTLIDHPITKGIDEVATFTGTSFQLTAAGEPLLAIDPPMYLRPDSERRLQGAVLPFGKGRVAVFGEAAMFSAQVSGPNRNPMGMNAPVARQNARFLLSVMHWLTASK